MKYLNAKDILPALLVKELQGYIQGGYIYIPANENQHRCWGEVSGYRGELQLRNEKIVEAYNKGFSIEHLAEKYSLSVSGIRRIIYQKQQKGAAPCSLFALYKILPKRSVDCCKAYRRVKYKQTTERGVLNGEC